MSYDCPERFNQQNNNQKSNSHGAKVNLVAAETVQEGLEIMMGTFSINSIPATVLFDSGASHTFISQAFVRVHSIPLVTMKTHMPVNSPGSASLSLRGVDFPVSPMVMRTSGIDVILGLDWMKKYTTEIKCKEKVVVVTTPKGERISVDVAVNQLDDDINFSDRVVNKFPSGFSEKLSGMLPDHRH